MSASATGPRFPPFWVRLLLAIAVLACFVAVAIRARAHPGFFLEADAIGDLFLMGAVFVWSPTSFFVGPVHREPRGRRLLSAALAGILASLAVNIAVNLLALHHPAATPGRFQVQPAQAHGELARVLLGVLGLVVAPMAENAFFFGLAVYLLRCARRARWLGGPVGLLGLAAFTAAHGPTALMAPVYGAAGLLIALTYWRRGYVASVVVHGAFNGAALYLLPLLVR